MKLQRYKRDSEISYAFGATLVAELLKTHPKNITRVFLRPAEKHGEDLIKIIDTLKQQNIEIIESTKAFNILGAKDNCLLIAEFNKNLQLNDPKSGPKIILVNPSDTGNLGTIMRSAAAFGYSQITIVNPGVDPYDPKVVRASMGALFHLHIETIENINKLILAPNSLAFILDENAVTLDEIVSRYNQDGLRPDLVFGNEAAGLPKDFCEKTGATPVFIPQTDSVDSLNLGVATSIALYTFRKI